MTDELEDRRQKRRLRMLDRGMLVGEGTDPLGSDPRKIQLDNSLRNGIQVDPAKAAEDDILSKQTGVPNELVAPVRDDIKNENRLKEINTTSLLEKSPVLAQFLSDQNNAAQAHDDVETLGSIEAHLLAIPKGLAGGWGKQRKAELRAQQLFHGGLNAKEQKEFEYLSDHGQDNQTAHDKAGFWSSALYLGGDVVGMGVRNFFNASQKTGETAGGMANAVFGDGDMPSFSDAVGLVVPGAAGVTAMAKGTWELLFDEAYSDLSDEYGLTEEQAMTGSLIYSSLMVVPEFIGAKKIAGTIPGVKDWIEKEGIKAIAKQLKKKGLFNIAKENAKGAAGAIAYNTIEEGTQKAVVIGLREFLEDDDTPYDSEQFGKDASAVAQEAWMAFKGSLILSGGGATASTVMESRQLDATNEDQARMARASQLFTESKLRDTNPAKFKEAIAAMGEESDTKTVYMEPEGAVFFMEDNELADTPLGQIITEQLVEKGENGGYIEIPIEVYAVEVAGAANQAALQPYMKLGLDSMTPNEAAQTDLNAEIENIKAMDVEVRTAEAEVYSEMNRWLQGVGYAPDTSEQHAMMYEAVFRTLAKKMRAAGNEGVTAKTLFDEQVGSIRNELDPNLRSQRDAITGFDAIVNKIRNGETGESNVSLEGAALEEQQAGEAATAESSKDQIMAEIGSLNNDLDAIDAGTYEGKYATMTEQDEATEELVAEMRQQVQNDISELEAKLEQSETQTATATQPTSIDTARAELRVVEALLQAAGLDPETMSNEEIREALSDMPPEAFDQAVFHGSPYKFPPETLIELSDGTQQWVESGDVLPEGSTVIREAPLGRFRLDKMGTGEGAQAFGYGLYLAQNRGVAGDYVRQGQQGIGSIHIYNPDTPTWYDEEEAFDEIGPIMQEYDIPGDIMPNQSVPGVIRGMIDEYGHLMNADEKAVFEKYALPEGSLYEVEIPDEAVDRMLDWDQPIGNKLAKIIDPEQMFVFGNTNGENAYNLLANRLGPEKASEFLNDKGIPGIKYFDGGSRYSSKGSGPTTDLAARVYNETGSYEKALSAVFEEYPALNNGTLTVDSIKDAIDTMATRNLVVFDENLLTITSVNGMTAEEVAATQEVAELWHASPFNFTRFDSENMSRGQGGQDRGWGWYTAENISEAEPFLPDEGSPVLVAGQKISDKAYFYLDERVDGDFDNAAEWLNSAIKEAQKAVNDFVPTGNNMITVDQATVDEMRTLDPSLISVETEGFMYNISVSPEVQATMIDQDANLSVQSEAIQALAMEVFGPTADLESINGLELWAQLISQLSEEAEGSEEYQVIAAEDTLYKYMKEFDIAGDMMAPNETVYDFHQRKTQELKGLVSDAQHKELVELFVVGNPNRMASKYMLSEYGIKGMKYLDGSSRASGEANRNLIVFSDNDLSITGVNGIPLTDKQNEAAQTELKNNPGAPDSDQDIVYEQLGYHGSRHLFERFDLSKVRSGEGKSYKGWGIYISEALAVAERYRKSGGQKTASPDYVYFGLIDDGLNEMYDLGTINGPEDVSQWLTEAAEWAADAGSNGVLNTIETAAVYTELAGNEEFTQSVMDMLQANAEAKDGESAGYPVQQMFALRKMVKDAVFIHVGDPAAGHLYTVEVSDSMIDSAMDWDISMEEQSAEVQEFFAHWWTQDLPGKSNYTLFNAYQKERQDELVWQETDPIDGWKTLTGGEIYYLMADAIGDDKEVSTRMLARGIRGIKFWDGFALSRRGGDRNYVVFDDRDAVITHRDGEAIGQDGWYHGGPGANESSLNVPAFLTRNRAGAEWFAGDRGGRVAEYNVTMNNPLDITTREGIVEFMEIARSAGADVQIEGDILNDYGWDFLSDDISNFSPYDGSNPIDMVYIPAVRDALKAAGYDAVLLNDILERSEIATMVALSPEQVRPLAVDADTGAQGVDGTAMVAEYRQLERENSDINKRLADIDSPDEMTVARRKATDGKKRIDEIVGGAIQKADELERRGVLLTKVQESLMNARRVNVRRMDAILKQVDDQTYQSLAGGGKPRPIEGADTGAKGVDGTAEESAAYQTDRLAYRVNREERAARAKALGFDISRVWYHGTESDFTEFNELPDGGVAGAFTENFSTAALFANEGEVLEVYLKNANIEEDGYQGDPEAYIESKDDVIRLDDPRLDAPSAAYQVSETAWHGSPYGFDAFDMSRIGSGVGALGHGWGLNFATNKDKGELYADFATGRFSAALNATRINGQTLEDFLFSLPASERETAWAMLTTTVESIARRWSDDPMIDFNTDYAESLREIPSYAEDVQWVGQDGEELAVNPAVVQSIVDRIDTATTPRNEGVLYEVSINNDAIDQMIDLDKTLEEQPTVYNKLKIAGYDNFTPDMTGADAQKQIGYTYNLTMPNGSVVKPSNMVAKDVSLELDRMGIPGNKYLEDGSTNIVTFSTKPVTITSINGDPVITDNASGIVDADPVVPAEINDETGKYETTEADLAEEKKWANWNPPRYKDGKYKGVPPGAETRGGLRKLRKSIVQLIDEGAAGRYWYEDSSRRILEIAQGNVRDAEKIIQLIAIYSPQSNVQVNTYFAVRAWNQYKNGVARKDLKVKTDTQDTKARKVLYDGIPFEGRKTDSFYKNLMHHILATVPNALEQLDLDQDLINELNKPVTIDMWMLRAYGYTSDAASNDVAGTGRYSFSENDIRRHTARMNKNLQPGEDRYTPHQLQAMIWSSMKARYEFPDVKAATWEESIAKGIATKDDKGKNKRPTTAEGNRQHGAIWRKHAMAVDTERVPAAVEESRMSFDDFLAHMTQVISWEAIPSRSLGLEILDASPETQRLFTARAMKLLISADGEDNLAALLGVPLAYLRESQGGYQGDIVNNALSHLLPTKGAGGFSVSEVRRYVRAIQYIYKQNAVPWFRADPMALTSKKAKEEQQFKVIKLATGAMVNKSRADTQVEAQAFADKKNAPFEEEFLKLYTPWEERRDAAEKAKKKFDEPEPQRQFQVRGGKYARGVAFTFSGNPSRNDLRIMIQSMQVFLGEDTGLTLTGPNEVTVINFRDDDTGVPFMDDEVFFDEIENFLDGHKDQLGIIDHDVILTQGEYGYDHNWKKDPAGEAILERSFSGSPGLQAWIRGRRAAFEQLLTEYSGEELKQREAEAAALNGTLEVREDPIGYAEDEVFYQADTTDQDLARAQAADNFRIRVEHREISTLPIGLDQVNSAEDVAHVLAPLRKHAQETMVILVLDKNNKPIHLIRHTKGFKDRTSVNFLELVGSIAATPGAASVWLGHNHPSGVSTPSGLDKGTDDYAVTEKFQELISHIGIEYRGHVVVGDGLFASSINKEGGRGSVVVEATIAGRRNTISLTERVFAKRVRGRILVNNPTAAIKAAKSVESDNAIILMDNKNVMIGAIPMSLDEIELLIPNGMPKRILAAMDKTNTAAVIVKTKEARDGENLMRFLNEYVDGQKNLRVVDLVYQTSPNKYATSRDKPNRDILQSRGEFLQKDYAGPPAKAPKKLQPRGYFNPRTREITLTPRANLSTFLHESGHLFLTIYTDLASASPEIQADLDIVMGWAGYKGKRYEDLDQDQKREVQEKFASGFEHYLFEGKAPTAELQSVFNKYQAWLVMIYKKGTSIFSRNNLAGTELSDEVREVMNRLMATEAEMDQAKQQQHYKTMPVDRLGLTPEQIEDYLRVVQEAEDEADAQLTAATMAEMQREREKWWKDEVAQERMVIAEEMEERQDLVVYDFLSGRTTVEGIPNFKLNSDLVNAIYGEDVSASIKGLMNKGGMHPDQAAPLLGYKSGEELVIAMANAIKPKDRPASAKAEAEARVKEREGDMQRDGTLYDAAQEAVHNDKQAKRHVLELHILNQKLGNKEALQPMPRVQSAAYKEAARQEVASMPWKDINPSKHLASEQKYGRQVARFSAKGEWVQAREAKHKQLRQFYLYKESLIQRQQGEKHRAWLAKQKTAKRDPKRYNPEYITQLRVLLSMFDTRKAPNKNDVEARLAKVNKFIQGQAEANPGLIADAYLDQIQDWRNMTVEDLAALRDAVKNLLSVGKQLSDVEYAAVTAQAEEAAQSILNSTTKKAPNETINDRTWDETVLSYGRRITQDQIAMRTDIRLFDDYETNGVWYRNVLAPIIAATNKRTKMDLAASEQINDMFLPFAGKLTRTTKKRIQSARGASESLEEGIITRRTEAGEKMTMSAGERVMLAVYWGSPDSREAILKSGHKGVALTENDVQVMLNLLTEEQKQLVMDIWAYNEQYWAESSRIQQVLSGVAPMKVDHVPFKAGDTVMPGGYQRIYYHWSMKDQQKLDMHEGDQNTMNVSDRIKQSKTGAMIERQGSGGREIRLEVSNVVRAADDVMQFIAFAEASAQVSKFLNHPTTKSAILEAYGKEKFQSFMDTVAGVFQGNIEAGGPINVAMRYVRSNLSIAYLTLSVRNMVQQPLALSNSFGRNGEVKTMKAMLEFALHPIETIKWVQERSIFMQERNKLINREVMEQSAVLEKRAAAGWIEQRRFVLQIIGDAIGTYPTWMASYWTGLERVAKPGMTKEEIELAAYEYADQETAALMGSGQKKDMAPMFQGSGTFARQVGPEVSKQLTFMGSFFGFNYNLYADVWSRARKGKISKTQFTREMMWYLLIPAIVGKLIVDRLPDDDDDEGWAKWMLHAVADYGLSASMMMRNFAGALKGFKPNIPAYNFISGVARLGGEVAELADEEETFDKADVASIIRALQPMVPMVGSGQVARSLEQMQSADDGEEDPSIVNALIKGKKR